MANTKITNPELFNLGDSTSATQLPVMTTTQRIAMNAVSTLNVDYLVVAGGGGGGMGYYGGGGGAGGLLTNVGGTSLVLATGGSGYTITVGDKGSAATSKTVNGTNGSDSQFNAIVANGGGGGGSRDTAGGSSGGSGGGSSNPNNAGGSGTVGQGNDGGTLTGQRYASGGGGANQAGQIPPQTYSQTPQNYSIGAPGGNGLEVNIIGGTGNYYAGGGGGGARATYSPNGINGGLGGGGAGGALLPGSNGIANTGGGGGGGGDDNDSGGSGGSGIVILRYPTADIASYTATGLTPTETTVGTDTILSFTTVGTGTITFTSSTPTGTISTGEMIFNSDTDKVEYFDGTKWYGITYEVGDEADLFGDGSNMFTSNFSNSTPTVVEGNGASIFASSGVIGYSSNVPNAGFGKSIMGTANINNQIFEYSMQSGDSVTSVKTISFWVYVTRLDDDDNWVLSTNMRRQNSPNQMWQYSWDPTSGAVGPIDTFTPVSINSWHNIVVVDEGTVMRTYLDNVSIGTINISSNILLRSTSLNLYSLSDADSRNTQFVTGYRMFDRAVTVSEVNTIFNEVPEYT